MNHWEILGSVLGAIGVWLMIRQNIWGWPVGLVQVSAYAWVFFDARLYSDALLQIFFFLLQAYGWTHWLQNRHTAARSELPVTRLRVSEVARWLIVGTVVTVAWGTLMHRKTDAALAYWDAFILVFSLIAQWLQARKILENWAGWLAVNTVAVGVYWAKDLHLTAVLYTVFWFMALWGWKSWRKSLVTPGAAAPTPRSNPRGDGSASPLTSRDRGN